ncbi:MAG: hypothetical protein K8R21_16115 [Leptospira sp.]|nr:hypothetical protein [Leptospira sp.]
MKKIFGLFFLFFAILLSGSCTSLQVIQEPNLGRIVVRTQSICFSLFAPFYTPWCFECKPNSILLKGIMENSSGTRTLFLEYYLKTFETELPVGVSLKLDNQYFILKKTETSYGENLKIVSELAPELIPKIESAGTVLLSYSSRSETLNIEFSSGERKNFLNFLKGLNEKISSLDKMNIQKL